MDYSDLFKESEKADFLYASWYSQLPNERKAQLFLSGFNFAADKVKYDTQQKNRFSTKAEIILHFIELTQKDTYPQETFDFIRQKMQERAEAEWKQRFKAMKKKLGWSYEEMARYMGASSGNSLKATVSRQLPAFAKLAVCVFEEMQGREEIK